MNPAETPADARTGTPDDAPAELSLVRHGRTVWHAENRYAGSSDVDLDPVGRDQADQLAAWVGDHPHDVVACSPLTRSRETAAPAARALGLDAIVVPGLAEADFGSAEGRTLHEVDRDRPGTAAAFRADPVAHPLPDAEDPAAVATRVRQALKDLAAAHPGARILVVGHNTALRLALCSWLGIPLAHYRRVLPRLDNAALTHVRVPRTAGHPPALLGLNVPTRPPDTAARTGTPSGPGAPWRSP
ncbi:histidine phosphatase family protein [Nocardiopsis sp. HNM0947]|uniref:Histidine phosphatase family protein n=1 Tax=Nocardiopsis coralli TaxID=2772213 RepID=A0ABR9P802_9ACTN|nr:histidine phosphatase family protein [Nocardiopsis coralli]MBE2999956.1 histidine phosphatase family protein [Nocardiopsis coralli]